MFKAFNFYLSQIFIFSLFFTTLLSKELPNREMIILLETTNAENRDITLNDSPDYKFEKILHPTGIGAMTITMLIALHQKAAPIIANKALIKNVIDHQNLFSDFITLDRNSLYNKYARYNRFRGRETLDTFITNCNYISNATLEVNKMLGQLIKTGHSKDLYKALDHIINDRRINLKSAPSNIQRLNQNDYAIKAFQLEMVVYTLCSWINFKRDWQIRQVNEDVFLLIPNDYLKKLNLQQTDRIIAQKFYTKPQSFTTLEAQLGLKIDHMKLVERSFFEQIFSTNSYPIRFYQSLEQIFITHTDIEKYNLSQLKMNNWSLYMAGHGIPKCAKINALPQMHALKNLLKKKLQSSQFKACFNYEKNKHCGLTKDENHLFVCRYHDQCKKHIDKIRKLTKEIKRIEPIKCSTNKMDQGMIASLSLDEFTEVLKFFNNSIETSFLYYTSCFAGGHHLIQPYLSYTPLGKPLPLILNYSIIAGTPAENMSVQEFPIINLPPYQKTGSVTMFKPSQIHENDLDLSKKELKLCTTLQFNSFFKALRKGVHYDPKKLILASYALHPHIDEFGQLNGMLMTNIPLIRLAHSDHFQPLPYDTSSILLDTKNHSRPLIVNKEAILLYTDYISGKIILDEVGQYQDRPQFLSMIPGFALHVFEELHSSTLSLNEIINSFLTFPELGSSKIFWIKKVECKDKYSTGKKESHKDVIIMRNVFNSNSLARCSIGQSFPLENCAYFSNNVYQEAQLTWNGPFIQDNNYRIHSLTRSDHQEECLHHFPHIANFLNPVLQGI